MFHKLKAKVAELYMTTALIPVRLLDLHFDVKLYDRHSRLGGEWKSNYLIPVLEDLLEGLTTNKKKTQSKDIENLYDDFEA